VADIFTKRRRSEIMARIRSKDTGPEIALRRKLFGAGLRFRKHYRTAGVNVDIAFPKRKVAVFVHGCFWHGHRKCGGWKLPKSNSGFWRRKIKRNRDRDRRVLAALRRSGWTPVVVWECQVSERTMSCALRIAAAWALGNPVLEAIDNDPQNRLEY